MTPKPWNLSAQSVTTRKLTTHTTKSPSRGFLSIAILTDNCPLRDWVPRRELHGDYSNANLQKNRLLERRQLLILAATAYLLKDCRRFGKFAFELMAIHQGSFAKLLNEDNISSILPPTLSARRASLTISLECLGH